MSAVQWKWTGLVDRRPFIPDLIYTRGQLGEWLVPLRRQDDPERWEELVASEEAIATKLESVTRPDGTEFPMWPISSSSAPRLMNAMIDALGLEPGMSVLEIGTGTGWNAAVLAEAGAVVTTVEIDPEIADHARTALARAGYPDVVVVTGDGEQGVPSRAPFDRVIVTAAAHSMPYAWVEQCRDGGRIVLPYTGPLCKYALAVLSVSAGVARGAADPRAEAGFMPLRGQGLDQAKLRAIPDKDAVLIEVGPHGQRVSAAVGGACQP